MTKRMTLSERDVDSLAVLTGKVGKLTLDQYASTWFGELKHPRQSAANKLRQFREHDLVSTVTATIHPTLSLAGPVFTWAPGVDAPNAERLSWILRSRWTKPPKRTTVIVPTRKAAGLVGGNAVHPPRSRALLHDIHVSAIYLLMRERNRNIADGWLHESTLYGNGFGKNGLPLPDAVIDLDQPTFIDFGGSYSAAKVRKLHRGYAAQGMAYQLW